MKKTLGVLLLTLPLTTFATTNVADSSEYIVPVTGPGIRITNPYTDYKIRYDIDDGKKIELHVMVLHLRTYKENADFSDTNKNFEEGSKTLFSYNTNIYTEEFINFTSQKAINSTTENIKKLYCAPDDFYSLSSQERLFYEARKEHKKFIINYYSDSGETLMFGVSISPESCNQK
ncbi:MAG: hypothetical protein E7B58_00650 [Citrobacter sp.]|uniref:hypothetical protein n=1 Tax=Citrobacter sp. TaxID=1896336 RepID=UPI0028FE4721|nr:hypothetical protein [Citrobacter sp.]MDU2942418.1 hypothetical protein [Citrobacter sp.]